MTVCAWLITQHQSELTAASQDVYQAGVVTNAGPPAHTVKSEAKYYSMLNFGHKPSILHGPIFSIKAVEKKTSQLYYHEHKRSCSHRNHKCAYNSNFKVIA